MRFLEAIEVAKIDANPANPRLHFPEEEIERLTESIAKEGILVPVVVYPEGDGYRLIDGERRWRCARDLGLETIPAVITDPPDARENLVWMFNIHMVREPWRAMATAWALEKLIDETGVTNDRELSDITGLSTEIIKRLRHALELPSDYQDYIDKDTIPLNFFWELKRNVIDPLGKRRPALAQEFGETEVLDAFVEKRLSGLITDVVSLRKVMEIIRIAEREVDDPTKPSVLDDTIRALVHNDEYTIDDAYQDTVEVIVEADKLGRRTDNMVKSFERLFARARTGEETKYLKAVAVRLIERMQKLVA
jgi:ParB family transcriptional regulator, chromosome partitioning protein